MHGDIVSINLNGFKVDKAEVMKVSFTPSKVYYDLQVEFDYPTPPESGEKGYTRIYNVDSALLT
jgi:hypothetical protein